MRAPIRAFALQLAALPRPSETERAGAARQDAKRRRADDQRPDRRLTFDSARPRVFASSCSLSTHKHFGGDLQTSVCVAVQT